jgi:hypothetical protein
MLILHDISRYRKHIRSYALPLADECTAVFAASLNLYGSRLRMSSESKHKQAA